MVSFKKARTVKIVIVVVLTVFMILTALKPADAIQTLAVDAGGQEAGTASSTLTQAQSAEVAAAQATESATEDAAKFTTIRVEQLESALAPKSWLETAKAWAESARTRNGALRYAILSPELRKKQYSDYLDLNWVIGNSSPWVQSYTIIEKGKNENDICTYDINYKLMDSTATITPVTEEISVQKVRKGEFDKWYVVSGKGSLYFEPQIQG
jgi:hypothetical protein